MRIPAAAYVLALLCAALQSLPAADLAYFRSNSIGLALAALPGFRPEEPYLLAVEREAGREVRTLYKSGRELMRWEKGPSSERVFEGGLLTEERDFDANGRPAAERFYRDGLLERRVEYVYGMRGLEAVLSYDARGLLISRDRYELGLRGELRRVSRQTEGGPPQSLALVGSGGSRFEQRSRSGGYELVERYDLEGRLEASQVIRDGKPGESLDLRYAAGSRNPLSSERFNPAAGTRTVTRFDGEGREVERESFQGGKRLEQWSFDYDPNGNRIQAMRRGERGLETWRYFYDGSGRLEREEHRIRGELVRVTLHRQPNLRLDELYREGAVFLRVTYEGGRKIQEEFLSAGQVIRVREFEGSSP